MCRAADITDASWYQRAFLRHPDGGEEGCFAEILYERALLAFRNLEGINPAVLSAKEARDNARKGVVGFIPNTVEDSLKKIHATYKKAMEDKVCCKSVRCVHPRRRREYNSSTPCHYVVSLHVVADESIIHAYFVTTLTPTLSLL